MENKDYLTKQIITYIGNKRQFIPQIDYFINKVKDKTKKKKLILGDAFAGSGIISRAFKQHASTILCNDFEDYSRVINSCYLTNKSEVPEEKLNEFFNLLEEKTKEENLIPGFITELYSPNDMDNINKEDRVFYTKRNAMYIDTTRMLIEDFCGDDEKLKNLLLAPLLYEASVHVNSCGIFKGFYKNKDGVGHFGGTGENALSRIMGDIKLEKPILSDFDCESIITQKESFDFARESQAMDMCYIDPPYNQHPYGSNYFMLNLITNYKKPENVSKVSGIPNDWKRSVYNKRANAKDSLFNLIRKIPSKYILLSYNSDAFITFTEMYDYLNDSFKYVETMSCDYPTFRASRNLRNRDIKIKEFMFFIQKQ